LPSIESLPPTEKEASPPPTENKAPKRKRGRPRKEATKAKENSAVDTGERSGSRRNGTASKRRLENEGIEKELTAVRAQKKAKTKANQEAKKKRNRAQQELDEMYPIEIV
jgi:hypothetical protein